MSTKETYMQKIDAELDVVQDKLTKFKAQSGFSAMKFVAAIADMSEILNSSSTRKKPGCMIWARPRTMSGSNFRTVLKVYGRLYSQRLKIL